MNATLNDFDEQIAKIVSEGVQQKVELALEEMSELYPSDILQDLSERVKNKDRKAILAMRVLIKACGVKVVGGMLGWRMEIFSRSEIERWLDTQEG